MNGKDWILLLVSALVGPAVGNVVFLLGTAIVSGALSGEALGLVLPSLPFAYAMALIPAVIAGAANMLVGKSAASLNMRLLLSLPIGAVAFLVMLNGLVRDDSGAFSLPDIGALGIAGALASIIPVLTAEAASRRPD